nr:hypothetical protein [Pseudomonas syringae pv. theae]
MIVSGYCWGGVTFVKLRIKSVLQHNVMPNPKSLHINKSASLTRYHWRRRVPSSLPSIVPTCPNAQPLARIDVFTAL